MRMGSDKATLALDGVPLWQRQWATLERTQPNQQWISLSEDMSTPLPEARTLRDPVQEAGPLAGVLAGLRTTRADLLLVLAVDLPRMTPTYLNRMLDQCRAECGCVPLRGDRFEPMAAVYPRQLLAVAEKRLNDGERSLQGLVRSGIAAGLLAAHTVVGDESDLFENINTAAEWQAYIDRPEA